MQIFTNKYSIILNQDKTEAMINFFQSAPVLPEEGQPVVGEIPSEVYPVASLAMTGQFARNFAKSLQELLD